MIDQNQKTFQTPIFNKNIPISYVNRKSKQDQLVLHHSPGYNIEIPEAAKSNDYVDKKCPFTGDVRVTGRLLKGIVVSTKMHRTIVIRRNYLHFIKKYKRSEKRHKNLSAHLSPALRVKDGDVVLIGECSRPLSKTVKHVVLRVERRAKSGLSK